MTPDKEVLKQIKNQINLMDQTNEYWKETVLLLRQIIPNELKEKVTNRINLEKLRETFEERENFNKQNYSKKPLNRVIYETGRTHGKFETLIALLLEDEKLFNKQP